MTPAQKDTAGTQIILHIKPDTETDHYDNFLDEYGIVAIVKKYSDYVPVSYTHLTLPTIYSV